MAEAKVKYDRQLRIWGEQGQAALEEASICLLNCGPTGSETLKNLVLGGVGSITVVDGSKVEAGDLGNNFMVDESSIGKSKAKCVCSFLQELNDAVKAKFIEEYPQALIETNPSFFSQFTLVVATQLVEDSMIKLDRICREANVMLIFARSYGLTGFVRISLKEHTVIESKPDHFLDDLRLNNPWPELKSFAEGIDLNVADPVAHKHIPKVVILVKMAGEWVKAHGGKLPSTRQEKQDFKELLKSRMTAIDEDNYKEALEASFNVFAPRGISSDLQLLIDDSSTELHCGSSDFWVMVAGLKEFIANEGGGEHAFLLQAVITLDHTWQIRNSNMEQQQLLDPLVAAKEITRRLELYIDAWDIKRQIHQHVTKSYQHHPIMFSTDIAFIEGRAWVGIVCTNQFGSLLSAWSFCSTATVSMQGELDGIDKASELASDLRIQNLRLSSDAKDVVEALQSNMSNMFGFSPQLADSIDHMKAKLSKFNTWSITFVPRSSNFLAHNVAKWGSRCKHYGTISISDLPTSIFLREVEM